MVIQAKNVKDMFYHVITEFASGTFHAIALFYFGHLLKLSHYAIWYEYNIMLKLSNNPQFNIPVLRTARIPLNSVIDLVHVGDYELYLILDFNIFWYDCISFLLVNGILQKVFPSRCNSFNCKMFTLDYMNLNVNSHWETKCIRKWAL